MYQNFNEFLDRQHAKFGQPPTELQKKKRQEEWLNALENLYREISSFLEPYINDGRIIFGELNYDISEVELGTYPAKQARIVLRGDANSQVGLIPVGTYIIGAKGRVDMVGPTGKRVSLLRVPKDAAKMGVSFKVDYAKLNDSPAKPPEPKSEPEWVWKIAAAPPDKTFFELTASGFLDALMFVMES